MPQDPKHPHLHKLLPYPGTFFLVRDETACEILVRAGLDNVKPEDVREIWTLQHPKWDQVFSIQVLYVLAESTVDRWFSADQIDTLAIGVREPVRELDPVTLFSEEIARIRTDHKECPSAWDDRVEKLLGMLDSYEKEIQRERGLKNFYVDSQARFREHCAASANKYADERNRARQETNAALRNVARQDKRIAELEQHLIAAQEEVVQARAEVREAQRSYRRLRSVSACPAFEKLIPRMGEIFGNLPASLKAALLAEKDCPPVEAEDVRKITMEDTFFDGGRVRVTYFAQGSSFCRFFHPEQIEKMLTGAAPETVPPAWKLPDSLVRALPFLSPRQLGKLRDMCAEEDSKWMGHEICNNLGLLPHDAALVFDAVVASGIALEFKLVYHCEEVPVRVIAASKEMEYPWECPECQHEFEDSDEADAQLRFDRMMRIQPRKS